MCNLRTTHSSVLTLTEANCAPAAKIASYHKSVLYSPVHWWKLSLTGKTQFRGNKKSVFIKFKLQCIITSFLTVMQQVLTHIYTSNFLLFSSGAKISAVNKEHSFYADHVRFDYFFLIALLNKYEGLYHTVILWWFE